jgi:F0F1-type ATP synthase assembly protein I
MMIHWPAIQHTEEDRWSPRKSARAAAPLAVLMAGSVLLGVLFGIVVDEAARHLLRLSVLGALAFGLALGAYVFVNGLLLTLVATGMRSDERHWSK